MSDYLLLEDGSTFEGELRAAKHVQAIGECVFNTSMTGYQEILTDPSYAGQIVTMTYPLIGNYGTNSTDTESPNIHCKGLIVRELSEIHSNFTSQQSLESYLETNNIPCMTEIDTRALTKKLRQSGAMNCIFVNSETSIDEAMKSLKSFDYHHTDFTQQVSLQQDSSEFQNSELPKVAVLDFGIKSNILRILSKFCNPEIYSAESFLKLDSLESFKGFFLSNGPGDPTTVSNAVPAIQKILKTHKPTFGICLGHQLLSIALGGKTYKLKFGHHGANHPVKNLLTQEVEISSQNHGYAVAADSLDSEKVKPTHINLNDQSLAGIMMKDQPVYSIQYHPEAAPGPHDSNYLFNKFKEDLVNNA